MKKSLITIAVMACTSAAALASTDTDSYQARLDHMNAEVRAMDQQISHEILNHDSTLAKVNNSIEKGIVYTDASQGVLFEDMPKSGFGLAFMQAKNKFKPGTADIGGYLESVVQYWHESNKSGPNVNGTDVHSTSATLDFMSNLGPWAAAFASIGANSLPSDGSMAIKKAILAFGNLDRSPIYVIAGKNYLPFGVWSGSGPWTSTTNKLAFRSTANQIDLGYSQGGLDNSLAVFNSAARNQVANFTYSLSYSSKISNFNYKVGGGYMNDARGASSGFGNAYTSAVINQTERNPLWDVNLLVGTGPFTLSGEYTTATKVTPEVITGIAGQGKANAWDASLGYAPEFYGKTTSFGLTYSKTENMNGISFAMPYNAGMSTGTYRSNWILSATREMFHDFFLGLDLSQAKTYSDDNNTTFTVDLAYYI